MSYVWDTSPFLDTVACLCIFLVLSYQFFSFVVCAFSVLRYVFFHGCGSLNSEIKVSAGPRSLKVVREAHSLSPPILC